MRRYRAVGDIEVAGVLASTLAYGRVSAFGPVLERAFAVLDDAGGPAAYVDAFDPARDAPRWASWVYRWNRGPDLVGLFVALGEVRRSGGLLAAFAPDPRDEDVAPGLHRLITALRGAARRTLGRELPRGLRTMLPSPADGSACKRWNLALRWWVRGPDGVDLGIWPQVPRRSLVIPLDTHVLRIAQRVGLTRRADGSWRTAREITDALARFDAEDPVRFDFALAHLGISGGCTGAHVPDVCSACPLAEVCETGQGRTWRVEVG